MRAKPEMEPWVHTDKSGLSSAGAAQQSERLVCVVAVCGFAFIGKVPLLRSSKCGGNNYPPQGLRPGL